ncbi:hypothetical protein [Paractinoplanes toevensis]|uniref:Uncharacterized protein n=1 Tax=Paractinoplanes toevensis TaxID=571911 RepID=A0A919WAW4_9ACTN|nr:hypothetical protein [Actinoplanes toevensis]GIM96849.1 hypothetical protein Ato02nite_086420 [Actinoplanes toevensis]
MPGESLAAIDFPLRFKVVNAVPVAAVTLLVGTIILAGAPGHAPRWDSLLTHSRDFGWTGAAAALAVTVAVALLAEPLELATIRLLEGYWPTTGPLRKASAVGAWLQRRQHARLTFLEGSSDLAVSDEAAEAKAVRFPPDPDRLLPTALGNRLRAFEDKAGAGYELDAITWWPRLYHALSDQTRATVDQYRNQLDVAARLTIAFAGGAVALAVLLAPYPLWWFVPALTGAFSWFAYRSALGAAEIYGIAVIAAIDVYRLHLLQEMRVEVPRDTVAERKLNAQLFKLWSGVTTANVRYQTTDSDHNIHVT